MGVATDANRSTGGPASDSDAAVGRASERRTARVAGIVALTVIAVAGGLKLAYPFSGDQALFATGGREILHGAVLYRDFWDVKQPAIYLFYAVGGAIFGFSPFGLHLFELIYILVFAVVLQRTLRPLFRAPWVAAAVSVLALGTFYAGAGTTALTQVEILVGFPLYLGVWLALSGVPGRSRGRLFWSGVLGGVVCWFKFVYVPIVAFAWLLALVRRPEGRMRSARDVVADAGAIVAGFAVPIVAFLAYFGAVGQLSEIRWTYFTFTPKTTGIAGRPISRLTGGAKDFAEWTGPVLVLAAVGFGLRFGRSTAVVARHDLGLTTAGRRAIEDREDAKYPTARALRAYLAEQHIRGDIYVLGNPIDQFVTGRDQAIPTNGWSPEQYDREVWSRVADAIRRDRPPLLVIDDYSAGIMRHRTPSTLAVVNRLYRSAKRVGDDTWYVRRS